MFYFFHIAWDWQVNIIMAKSGFYTKLNVWGSLGLNFDYNGGPIIENGGPIFLYMDSNRP